MVEKGGGGIRFGNVISRISCGHCPHVRRFRPYRVPYRKQDTGQTGEGQTTPSCGHSHRAHFGWDSLEHRTTFRREPSCKAIGVTQSPFCRSVTVAIGTSWDNRPLSHGHARVHLHQEQGRVIPVTVEADFFDDPAPPAGTKGQPLFGLWEYEVVELFILGEYDRYLELEFCP
ncbi:hypothetical protein HPB47_014167 [Ixodes persulcatus]|uniref:Uncharacterized protein n=1 Tax=Ixodes persulcatus TaxID=34615 RepID=A0AC60QXI9_IXOPE|nr:hypothetical protein HPB47_014167 [Ixodes persulcatus]